MPWFRVDDQLDANKKVKSIPRRTRAKALGLWVQAGAWCARELTDGHVPKYMLEDFAVTPAVARALVDAGMWEEANDGWTFVNWDEFNPSSTDVRSKRAAARKRQAEFREKKKQERENARTSDNEKLSQRDNSVTNNVTNSVTNGGVTRPRPDPTRPDHINKGREEPYGSSARETENSPEFFDGLDALAAAHAASDDDGDATPDTWSTPDDPRCKRHADLPREQVPRCVDCRRAREWFNARVLQAIETRRAEIDACPHCDQNGMREATIDGVPAAIRCDHTREDENDLPPWEVAQ